MRDIDYVFNPAAVTSPPEFEDIDGKGYEINIMGTYNILKAAYKNNVKKVILASSSAIYGDTDAQTDERRLQIVILIFMQCSNKIYKRTNYQVIFTSSKT